MAQAGAIFVQQQQKVFVGATIEETGRQAGYKLQACLGKIM